VFRATLDAHEELLKNAVSYGTLAHAKAVSS